MRIRAKETRVRLLQTFKETSDQFAEFVTGLYQSARVDLAADVRLVLQTADAIEALPTTLPPVRETVSRAARPLRSLLEGRKADALAASAATRARNAETETTVAQKDEENSTLREDNSRLSIENRYLAGEALRPTDVLAAPALAPAPARAARRSPRRTPR